MHTNYFCDLQQLYPQCPKNDFKIQKKTAILKRLNLIQHSSNSYIQSYGLMIVRWLPCQNQILKDGN